MTDTSIRLQSDTRDRIRAEKKGGETYDETLNRVLDRLEEIEQAETVDAD